MLLPLPEGPGWAAAPRHLQKAAKKKANQKKRNSEQA